MGARAANAPTMSLTSELTSAQKLIKSGDLDSAFDCCRRALKLEGGNDNDKVHLCIAAIFTATTATAAPKAGRGRAERPHENHTQGREVESESRKSKCRTKVSLRTLFAYFCDASFFHFS